MCDLLQARPDVDPSRVGMTGVSLGGMHTWLCAALDERVAVAAPMIGVQNFGWALDHDQWQARAGSVPRYVWVVEPHLQQQQLAFTCLGALFCVPLTPDLHSCCCLMPSLAACL